TVVSLAGYMLFAAFQHQWAFYAAALLIGLGNGHMYPAFLNMFVKVARHDQRGTANSSILTSWDMGMGLGILLGGVLAEYSGFDATFWTMAFMQLAGTLLFLFFTKNFFLGRQLAGE
ncbi:MFS transporter, partial [uncultured Muribaculum sp.]